ncbi:phosphonate ABC transporter substrate-binding protein [Rhodospira trueperi]|uniref:Phosphonate transport system substrate-binding protein n=1 Tax=Rhodospira trueperi TaxID=69960 RepID=A0A1G6Z8U6_9PROT|nr:phosphonate ABC transporter substrate-binding protein [Rhodospira trueperi]SDD98882.1 phosphonate transport system substrate-binding protein [Rhodospira trueperi]
MSLTRRTLIAAATAAATLAGASAPALADWREDYPTLRFGVITSENEADRTMRFKPVQDYLEEALGVTIEWRTATDYAGIIEGVRAGKIEIARFGPASYSKCWMVTDGKVEPLVGELDLDGNFGYHSVVVVKADSPYQSIDDLEGKSLAFADPNSTSGHQAPRFFLGEAGYDPDAFFGSTGFSGSHENSVMAVLNGTYDAAATWWRDAERSNPQRMANKGMIEDGSWRVIWTSPKLPSSPWAMSTELPEDMRTDVQQALYNMKEASPEAWESLTDGQASGFKLVTHADYEGVVRMIQTNLADR